MVRHQDEREQRHIDSRAGFVKERPKHRVVDIVDKQRATIVASVDDVQDAIGWEDSSGTRHGIELLGRPTSNLRATFIGEAVEAAGTKSVPTVPDP